MKVPYKDPEKKGFYERTELKDFVTVFKRNAAKIHEEPGDSDGPEEEEEEGSELMYVTNKGMLRNVLGERQEKIRSCQMQ